MSVSLKTVHVPCAAWSVVADFYTVDQPRGQLLLLPGYQSSRQKYAHLAEKIARKAHYNVLVLEYSGHGESKVVLRTIRQLQHIDEVFSSYEWLHRQNPDMKISVMGTSYGGYLATHLAKVKPIRHLILRVPAIYKPEDIYKHWGNMNRKWLVDQYRNNNKLLTKNPLFQEPIKHIPYKLLVVHENDEWVPRETTDQYNKILSGDVLVAKNFTHDVLQSELVVGRPALENYHRRIIEWLMVRS